MAESNSDIVVCPCGFFGRSETAGLCSKCYKEHLQRKTAEADGTASKDTSAAKTISTEQISQALAKVGQTNQASSQDTSTDTNNGVANTPTSTITPPEVEKAPSEEKDDTKTLLETDETSSASSKAEPSTSNGTKRVRAASESESVPDGETDANQPVQKNKKRCFTCNCKLQPAIREIGKCKCELVFCQLHRLPEQHDCIYDHKEKGRQAAREKMVSPKKHMGNSLKRIDSDS